jgi:SnoaL-like domain
MTAPDLLAEFAELRRRVDTLESREQIQLLRNRFHDYVNTDRWAEIGSLFTDDAELDYDTLGRATGRASITDFFAAVPERLPSGTGPFIRQFIHAHSVEVDGSTATGTSHLFATPVFHGVSHVVSARFTDTYARVDGGEWLFASVTMTIWYAVPIAEGWASEDRIRL